MPKMKTKRAAAKRFKMTGTADATNVKTMKKIMPYL